MAQMTLLAAAVLTIGLGAVHSWLGEQRLIGPLLSPKNQFGILAGGFARKILRFAWHLTTLAWWGMAAILMALARSPLGEQGRMAVLIIAATVALTGIVIFVASRGRHLAWPVCWLIAGLAVEPVLHSAP